MSTLQRTLGLSEPTGAKKISAGILAYIRSRNRQRAYDLVVKEFKKSGLTQADLARRLGKPREVISRLLARPSNWETDTFSDLLFAISGAVASYRAEYPLSQRAEEIPAEQIKPTSAPIRPKQASALETKENGLLEEWQKQARVAYSVPIAA